MFPTETVSVARTDSKSSCRRDQRCQWVGFSAEGEIQPFENVNNYRKPKVVDRFTVEMLEFYCAALGIEVFGADFYGGQCLLSHTKRTTPPGPTMSISEARSHLYL